MSSKALYIVQATPRNISGSSVVFNVADGFDVNGRPTFSGEVVRQVGPGRTVLAIPMGRADLKIGLYRVSAGNQMQAQEKGLIAGEVIAITCPPDGPEGVPEIAGTTWTVTDDLTVVNTAAGALRSLQAAVSELFLRVPAPPVYELEPEEIDEAPLVDDSILPQG